MSYILACFIVLLFIRAPFYVLLVFVAMCSVFWLFRLNYQYLPSNWSERLLWGSLIVAMGSSPESPSRRVRMIFLVYCIASLLPAGCREAANCRYCFYSQAKNQVFRPAGATRCTDSGQTLQDRRAPGSAWPRTILHQSAQGVWMQPQKYQKFPLFGKGATPLTDFQNF